MAEQRLNIKITADAASAKREMTNFQNSFTELASKISLAQQGIQMFAQGVQKVYDLGKAGAELDRTRGQLDKLAVSIGTTSDALLNKMADASGGLMSNAEMINAATQIISLGLADNETDVIRLASIVSELGWDMQQVILTFANNSTMRLDALGLSVQDVTSKAKALEEQGFDADKAFDLAVLEAAEEKIGLVGSQAETASGQFAIFEANIKDAGDELKLLAMDAVLPIITGYNEMVAATDNANNSYERQAVLLGLVTNEELDTEEATRDLGAAMMWTSAHVGEFDDAVEDAVPSVEELADATRKLGETNQTVLEYIQSTIDAILSYADPEFLQAKLILESLVGLWEQGQIPLETLGILASDLQTTLTNGESVMDSAAANFLELMNNAGGAADEVGRLERLLAAVSGDYYVRLFVDQIGDISLDAGSGGIDIGDVGGLGGLPPGQTDPEGPGNHSGANFVVPPGFPNDSFPMRVESGEHVQVTPANQVGLGGGGAPVIVLLDGEQIAARVLSTAGSQYRQTRANGGAYVGR